MKSFRTLALFLALPALSVTIAGCAGGFSSFIAESSSGLQVATVVVDSIDAAQRIFFAQSPNAAKQATITQGIADARASIVTASEALQTTEDFSQGSVNQAFADLETTYSNLLTLVTDLGITAAPPGSSKKLGATAHGLVVPAPADLVPKLR